MSAGQNTDSLLKPVSGIVAIRSDAMHPSWLAFVKFCTELKHGEIEHLKIQDGLPVLAEVIRKKVKFT